MPPMILAAVQKAALYPVRLHGLQMKPGEYLARQLKREGAVVTSGAAGAIALATAARIQDASNIDVLSIPQALDENKNQVIRHGEWRSRRPELTQGFARGPAGFLHIRWRGLR